MTKRRVWVVLLLLIGCSKKPDDGAADRAAPQATPQQGDGLVEHDLSAVDAAFAGYVVTAPKQARVNVKRIWLSPTDSISIWEAPAWEDAVKAAAANSENRNFARVTATEARWERTLLDETHYVVDVLVDVDGHAWSCGTGDLGTSTSTAVADQIATICKSIKKKG